MGESTFINPPSMPQSDVDHPSSNAQKRRPHSLFLQVDVTLLLVVACLVVIGLLMVYSSSWKFAVGLNQDTSSLAIRQIIWAILGGVCIFIFSHFDYHQFQRWLVVSMIGTLILLVAVLWASQIRYNASRTLLSGSIQPSELAKLVIIIYLSFWLYSKRDKLNQFSFGLLPMAVILGITSGLILLQPDLSAAFTVIILGGLLFFLAGGEMKQIALVALIAVLMMILVISVSATGRARLSSYLLGLKSPTQASDQVRTSMESVVRGGLFGVGIGNGFTKVRNLPLPWTDSIFAVIAEETGFAGAFIIVALYVIFLWRGLKIAQQAPDMLGKLLASGITFWVVLEALLNMGVSVNLFPVAGNALPLVSAGGSSLVMIMIGIGILMNIARAANSETKIQDGRLSGALVDLRGRDGRRRVSRARRVTNAR